MIKNEIFSVYDRMDKAHLELMAASFEADLQTVGKDFGRGDFIKARLGIIYGLLKYKIHNDWLPIPENTNALPEPVRKYIHGLVTNCDPAQIVRENILIKDTCKMLVIRLEEKLSVTDEWINAKAFLLQGAANNFVALRQSLTKALKEAGVKVVKK